MLSLANRRLVGPALNGGTLNKVQRTDGFESRPGKAASRMESAVATIPRPIRAPVTAASWAAPARRVGT